MLSKQCAHCLFVVASCFFVLAPVTIVADETVAPKNNAEFQVDVLVDQSDVKNMSLEEQIKRKLLLEKLVKMGRARSQGCTRCHGRAGMLSLAKAAKWDGTIQEFVGLKLTEFREGTRVHEVMTSIAASMSNQDIALVSLWYESVSQKK